jgi:hypothetical protein
MTKKHFETIALILAETLTPSATGSIGDQLDKAVDILRGTNERFDSHRFCEAVRDLVSGRRPSGFSTALWGEYEARNRI